MAYSLKTSAVARFFWFINERHAIYLRRKAMDEFPWTDDPYLRTYKFTNVFRELDTGTIYCKEAIRDPLVNAPADILFFNVAMYRRHNLIATHKALGNLYEYDADEVVKLMKKRAAAGKSIFTSAYMTCGGIKDPNTGLVPHSKIDQIFGIAFKYLWDHRFDLMPTAGDYLESAWAKLNSKCPGYGPFIAYEVITDLRHTWMLENAPDIMTWANPGPGAQKGIGRLMGLHVNYNTNRDLFREHRRLYGSHEEQIATMRFLLKLSPQYLQPHVPKLEMRDIEHSLCEFDKYERARRGEGRPKQRYVYHGDASFNI